MEPDDDTLTATFFTTCAENGTSLSSVRRRIDLTVPRLVYGTYLVPSTAEGESAVCAALTLKTNPYRHLDCAPIYRNEHTVGKAIRRSGVERKDLFLTSKVWNDAQRRGRAAVRESVLQSICDLHSVEMSEVLGSQSLSTPSPSSALRPYHLDMVLVHWPVPGHHAETYKELEVLYEEGFVRAVGMSNYSVADHEELLQSGIKTTPAVNQIEASPFMYRREMIEHFQKRGVAVAAFKPLGRGAALNEDAIVDVANRHERSSAQILLRWCLEKKLIVISKTMNPSRMKENVSILNFSLSDEDMALLDCLTTNEGLKKREIREMESKNSA